MPWFPAYGGFTAGFQLCRSSIDPSSTLNTSTFNGRQHLSISCSLSLPNPHNERSPPGQVPANISFAWFDFEWTPLTQSHQQVLLRQKLNIISRLRWTWIHEIPPFIIETCHLKQIDHIMNVRLIQTIWDDRTGQVRMTVIVIRRLSPGQHGVDVGVTSRTQQIMDSPSMLINAVPRQSILDDGAQRPHIRQTRPQPVVRR